MQTAEKTGSFNNKYTCCFLLGLFLFSLCTSAYAWKPTTHVYLVQKAMEELEYDAVNDEWLIPIYRTNYSQQTRDESPIKMFPANQALVEQLLAYPAALNNGIIGPDGYPDLPTGQTRIHVSCPLELDDSIDCPIPVHSHNQSSDHSDSQNHGKHILSDDWLRHVWNEAEKTNIDENKAFAFGYLTHAAGDMFMHTFVNYFAGGPFKSSNDNGLRHFIIESYIGQRTEPLSSYSLPFSDQLSDFIYDTLVDASRGSKLHTDLLIEVPLHYSAFVDQSTAVSIPRHFSTLKNHLITLVERYDRNIERLQSEIDENADDLLDCLIKGADFNLLNDCSIGFIIDLTLQQTSSVSEKSALVLSSGLVVEYFRNWISDIERGLRQWPKFSHEVAKNMLFSPTGMDRDKLLDLWVDYRNNYFIDMLGPDIVGDVVTAVTNVKNSLYDIAQLEKIDKIKENFINNVLSAIYKDLTIEQLEDYIKNPELNIDRIVNKSDTSIGNPDINLIGLTELNALLKISPSGLNPDNTMQHFDSDKFAPAYNTKTMIKLMLLSQDSLVDLYKELTCEDPGSCFVELPNSDANAMLGFIRSMDGGNEWHNHDKKMSFGGCSAYQQIFMQQTGETEGFEEDNAACVEIANAQTSLEQLALPNISPTDSDFDAPFEINLSHPDSDVQIYYTISDINSPHLPSNKASDSFSQLYTTTFTQFAPFDQVKPLTLRAIAYKDGFRESEIAEYTFTINATQSGPTFFPTLQDYIGSTSITMSAPFGFTIFYSTNGAIPDYTSTRYQGPVRLNIGQYNIQAIAYKIGYPPTDISRKIYNIWSGDGDNVNEPNFTPNGSAIVTRPFSLKLKTDTLGANIHYTIQKDGKPADPTQADLKYTGPISLTVGNWFINAKAFDPSNQLGPSTTRPINFDVWDPVGSTDLPTITPNGGTFYNAVSVQLSGQTTPDNQGSPRFFYTKDGTEPYANPFQQGLNNKFTLFQPGTLKVQALQKFFSPSPIASARFDFYAANPVFEPANGEFINSVEITLTSITQSAKVYYTIDGTEPNTESNLYEAPFSIFNDVTVKAKAFKSRFYDSETIIANYRIKTSSAPLITLQPLSKEYYQGQDISLTSNATAFPKPTYQWYKNNILMPDETYRDLTIPNSKIEDTGTYYAEASNTVGSSVTDSVEIKVNALPDSPKITAQPTDLKIVLGEDLELSVSLENTNFNTQFLWFQNDTPLLNQTTDTLKINFVTLFHAGSYKASISNLGGVTISDPINVSILDNNVYQNPQNSPHLPEILFQPSSVDVTEEAPITLAVVVNARPEATFLWMRDQRVLTDQVSSSLEIDSALANDAGDYRVIIKNSVGTVISDPAQVTVNLLNKEPNNSSNPTADPEATNNDEAKKSSSGAINGFILFVLAIGIMLVRRFQIRDTKKQ